MQTTNQVDENIKKIAELFPNCLTERLDERNAAPLPRGERGLRQHAEPLH